MKAMILAAGLGTRLKPWTLSHPKALVPVGGVPMLERVIASLESQGFDRILVNVHHFAGQVTDFLARRRFRSVVGVSDESGRLLDTGGALVGARGFFKGEEGVLVHNVDILGNARLADLMEAHRCLGAGATLLVSQRESNRKLVFNGEMDLRGWHDVRNDVYRPEAFRPEEEDRELAFSGIHVVGGACVSEMEEMMGRDPFPVMDYYLAPWRRLPVMGHEAEGLRLIDIGKPESLERASELLDG